MKFYKQVSILTSLGFLCLGSAYAINAECPSSVTCFTVDKSSCKLDTAATGSLTWLLNVPFDSKKITLNIPYKLTLVRLVEGATQTGYCEYWVKEAQGIISASAMNPTLKADTSGKNDWHDGKTVCGDPSQNQHVKPSHCKFTYTDN